jgi:predicted nicotinamide N-methyase
MAEAATLLNAAENHVRVDATSRDVVGAECRWDLILCGDVCYEAPMTGHILPWLRRMARAAMVLVADPGRAYVPRSGMVALGRLVVPTTRELEDRTERTVTLWRMEPE